MDIRLSRGHVCFPMPECSVPLAELARASPYWRDIAAECSNASQAVHVPVYMPPTLPALSRDEIQLLLRYVTEASQPGQPCPWLIAPEVSSESMFRLIAYANFWRMDRLQKFLMFQVVGRDKARFCAPSYIDPALVAEMADYRQTMIVCDKTNKTNSPLTKNSPAYGASLNQAKSVHYIDYALDAVCLDPATDAVSGIFQWCIEAGNTVSIQRLLKEPRFDPTRYQQHALNLACRFGQLAALELLLEDPRVNPAECEPGALAVACHQGHLAIVDRLIRDGRVLGPEKKALDPVFYACQHGNAAVLERLLQEESFRSVASTRNSIGMLVLSACNGGHLDIVKLLFPLVGNGVLPSTLWEKACFTAWDNGHYMLIESIVRMAGHLMHSDVISLFLRLSVRHGQLGIVRALLALPDCDPSSAALYAAHYDQWDMVRVLLSDVRTDPSWDDNTLLFIAKNNGRTDIVHLLLRDERVNPAIHTLGAHRWMESPLTHQVGHRRDFYDAMKLLLLFITVLAVSISLQRLLIS